MTCWSEFLDRKTETQCNPDCPIFSHELKVRRIVLNKLSGMKRIPVDMSNAKETINTVKVALPTLRRAIENELRRNSLPSLNQCDNQNAPEIPQEFK